MKVILYKCNRCEKVMELEETRSLKLFIAEEETKELYDHHLCEACTKQILEMINSKPEATDAPVETDEPKLVIDLTGEDTLLPTAVPNEPPRKRKPFNIDRAVELKKEGKSVAEIADALETTSKAVSQQLYLHRKKHPEL